LFFNNRHYAKPWVLWLGDRGTWCNAVRRRSYWLEIKKAHCNPNV
jgi:hypothetical protein